MEGAAGERQVQPQWATTIEMGIRNFKTWDPGFEFRLPCSVEHANLGHVDCMEETLEIMWSF